MNPQEETIISCPYCGEPVNIMIEYMGVEQEYIEDCQVCCRPITFIIRQEGDHFSVITKHENE